MNPGPQAHSTPRPGEERPTAATVAARLDGPDEDAPNWRNVVEALTLFVVRCAEDGTVVGADRNAAEVLGLPRTAGARLWEATAWTEAAQVAALKHALLNAAPGRTARLDLTLVGGDSKTRVVETSIVHAPRSGPAGPGVIVAGIDITERAAQADALAAANKRELLARARAEAMATLSRSLAESLDIEGIGRAVARYAPAVAGGAFANFGVIDRTGAFLRLFHGDSLPTDVEDRWPSVPIDDTSPLGAAVRTGRVQWAEDPDQVRSRFPAGAADAERAGFRSLTALPVVASGRVAAAIGFAWSTDTNAEPALMSALQVAAQICGQAVERAERRARQLSEARELQVRLLPRVLVDIPALDIAARYLPASSESAVGGDWYDVLRLDEGRVALIVGDVVGHGVRAAAAMGQLRSAIQALARTANGPAMLLEQLDVFAAGVDGATMATAAVAYLDLARRELCYSLAGHVPPLLLTNGQPVRLDVARGAPLSIRLGRARPEATVRVEEGSTLLLYTDGLVERPGEDLAAGMERLGECLATALGRPDNRDRLHIEGICDRLVELASVGVPQHDDLAALCVRFASPSTDRLRIRLPAATAQLAPLRQRLREWLGSRGIAAADIDDLLVITGEAAANSIEHGYFHDWAAGELAVEVELHGTTVSCRVRDFGRWRYPPARGDRGRGLRLVRALAERVELTRGLQGTTLVIDYRCRDGSAPR